MSEVTMILVILSIVCVSVILYVDHGWRLRNPYPKWGDTWIWRQDKNPNPFKRNEWSVQVLDVKEGFVKYKRDDVKLEDSMCITSFVHCYKYSHNVEDALVDARG